MSPDQTSAGPLLRVHLGPEQPGAVTVSPLSARQQAALARLLEAGGSLRDVLMVSVIDYSASDHNSPLPIKGRYQVFESELRFLPHFPLEPGVHYRATFHAERLGDPVAAESTSLEYFLPEPSLLPPTIVEQIYPTAECLPENLLRFYIVFSEPMWRGYAEQQIQLLGPDGVPAQDVLYRSPVELWDRNMQTLTILLDPGRLKRGVGPHRELGPPLVSGQCYTLSVGAGMLNTRGQPLAEPKEKRFCVSAPVRDAIAVEQWRLTPPAAHTLEALVLRFPVPLDWAMLATAIVVTGKVVEGHVAIDEAETRWSLTPVTPWSAGSYKVLVHCQLEDVCGNSTLSPFDRPLRQGGHLCNEEVIKQMQFTVATVA